ncbi:MAG: hypothetical protein QNJ70_25835 [Xenococcaceae cyanobacterium MO_207.B15]|nr:hypothetical protein [Xenococcaceae cyanobacterium MO_207.B15]
MVNTIGQGDYNLVRVDYSSLLDAIFKALENTNPFRISKNGKQLFIDIDDISYNIATKQDNKIQSPLGSSWRSAKVATTNFTEGSKDKFVTDNRKIRERLQKHLESVLKDKSYESIEHYLKKLWTILSEFQGNVGNQISLNYDFNKKYPGLSKQRLTLKHEEEDRPILKFHRLTISIKISQSEFDLQLKKSLENYIERNFSDSDLYEEIDDILEDLYNDREQDNSGWYALKQLMNKDAIARVQRTAKIKYLEYILEHIGEHYNAIYLEILIKRLQALESYINDPNKADGDYQVSYASVSCNLREIFAQANAFDSLPIIPLIDGGLGEIRDNNKGELSFIFGLKLKFGGKIQNEDGKTVLESNLDLINPESEKHKEALENGDKKEYFVRKILGKIVLYFFVFAAQKTPDNKYNIRNDLDYEVINKFEQNILPTLQISNEDEKRSLFKRIINGINQYGSEEKINKLKDILKTKIKTSQLWTSRRYPIQIHVKQGVLEEDANKISDSNTLFRDGLTKKPALKYISVSDTSMDTSSLCYLSGNIKFDEIGYFETDDNQEFSMEYNAGKFPTIPIICYPKKQSQEKQQPCKKILDDNFLDKKIILFPYQYPRLQQEIFKDSEATKAFIYRFTFSLLSHITLKILLDTATEKLQRKVFIPILRLQLGDKQNPLEEETFMRSNFATLSHLININHRSSSQGICIKKIKTYKNKNALSSLYNILPKKFQLNNPPSNSKINKLAIVVVSSRECDRVWRGDYKKSNLIGEVIKIDRRNDGSILVYTSKTISEHYDSNRLHNDPDALVREVETLYKYGYRHILYIAKSPYSQTLNLTATEKDDRLYFMSPSVIRNLKGNREDLKIYPVFFDKYYVVRLQGIARKSLYIQDAEELTNIVNDPTKQIAVFFNLFNGIQVAKDSYYNGVISYSTLLNIYDQKLLDTDDIYAGLINNDQERGLKNEILQLLTLFHFSRYEADTNTKYKDIQLKLDPYQNIIGDQSIGALSLFPHIQPKIEFNCLAFLNEVNDALDANLATDNE